MAGWERIHLIDLGGLYLPDHHACVGPQTIAALQRIRADVAVIGCDGVSAEAGVTTPNQLVAEVDEAMLAHAGRGIVVVDSTKIGRVGFSRIAPISAVDVLITDTDADPEEIDAVRAAGVEVVLV